MSKILCVDFDGVIHSYTSGWQGYDVVNDDPVPGALQWLVDLYLGGDYEVHIYSSRSKYPEGISAMREWLKKHLTTHFAGATLSMTTDQIATKVVQWLQFPAQKPPAYLTIDDRAICFRGTFPSVQEMNNFKAWNK